MCTAAMNNETGDEIASIADIKKICRHIIWQDVDGSHLPDESCLCWVDIPATLIGAGYRVWLHPHVIPEYLFDKPATLQEGNTND